MNHRTNRPVAATAAVLLLVGSVPAHAATPWALAHPRLGHHVVHRPGAKPAGPPLTRPIAIVVNGETVSSDPPPIVQGGRLLIPLRAIMGSLGLSIVKSGTSLTTTLPTGRVDATIGSSRVQVNGRPVDLDAPIRQVNGTTYVPLRFVSAAVGAVVSYDQRAASIQIVSAFVGRNAEARQALAGGGSSLTGVAANVDTSSNPRTITILVSGNPHTIAVDSGARVNVNDATNHGSTPANLDDIVAGDAVRVLIRKDGRVVRVDDFFESRSGRLAAVSPGAVVLESGRVISPAPQTTISLDGTGARLTELRIGDFVTVRSNPETGELREIIASRGVGNGTPAPAGPVRISSFEISATRPLRSGERFTTTLAGTPHARATFDIGDAVRGIAMTEGTSGEYSGTFVVPSDFNVTQVPVFGHLVAGAGQAPRAEAARRLSISTTSPVVSDVAPGSGQSVNTARPSLYATFSSPSDVGINPSTVQLSINGHDVTSSATRSDSYVTYVPPNDYPDGRVTVTVRVADLAGNTSARTWTFSIRTH